MLSSLEVGCLGGRLGQHQTGGEHRPGFTPCSSNRRVRCRVRLTAENVEHPLVWERHGMAWHD